MTPPDARERLIVALDMSSEDALAMARTLSGEVAWVKIGMTLFYKAGPEIVARLAGLGLKIFLDLKLHDIPHQVEGAAREIASLGVQMLTVHASGGSEMVEAAVRGARQGAAESGYKTPVILAVTVLTSLSEKGLNEVGVGDTPQAQVLRLARLAVGAGADGVVCSPLEATAVREALGSEAYVVTPGVRPAGSETGDQSRIATPGAAIGAGASHLVVGRPVTGASDPVDAARSILAEMESL